MPETIELRDGGSLYYDPSFLSPEAADALFATLRHGVPWKQERGRFGPQPRLTAFYADDGVTYRYSGVTHTGFPWTPELLEVKRRIEAVSQSAFNSLLLNFYRDGQDSMGFHADDERELGEDPVVGSVSLGGVRKFVIKHRTSKESLSYQLAHGSLLVMGGSCQRFWVHAVPKTETPVAERINLTFRLILALAAADAGRRLPPSARQAT